MTTTRLATLGGNFGLLLVELVVLFVAVSFAVALLARRFGLARLRVWMGGGRVAAALKGIGLGAVTPFCTYSAIPVFVALVDSGARTAASAGFLLAAPVLDPFIVLAIAVIFGPRAAMAYTAATAGCVLAVALAADAVRAERFVSRAVATAGVGPAPRHAGSGAVACELDAGPGGGLGDGPGWRGWAAEARAALQYATGLTRSMALPLVVAVAVAVAVAGFVPRGPLVALAGPGNPFGVPLAAVVGAPFYVSGEAFIPIAAALRDAGMGEGATFALVISAAGVNIPEFGLLSRLLAPRLLAGLVLTVVLIATAAGYAIPTLG